MFFFCCYFSIGLDPDESEVPDPTTFNGLESFLMNDLSSEEYSEFFNNTLPSMARRALQLKTLKPPYGLRFSLQQQGEVNLFILCFYSIFGIYTR